VKFFKLLAPGFAGHRSYSPVVFRVGNENCRLIHDFGLLNALSEVPAVRSALLQASEELKTRLATGAVAAAPGLK
jgi:hypothetical protein